MSHHAQLALPPVVREWSLKPNCSRHLLEILRVRLYVDLDVSEDERLPSGELVLGVKGTSLAVCTESPSLSLLRLAILQEETGHQWLWRQSSPEFHVASSCSVPSYTVQPLPFPNREQHSVAEHKDSYLRACMVMMQPLNHATSLRTMEI